MKLILTAIVPLYAAAFAPSTQQNHAIKSNVFTNPNNMHYLNSNMALDAAMTQVELPEKLYFPKEKEAPKVLGGLSG